MPAFTARAPGKIILFGEHAVVYGQPAIAVPVTQVQATARVTANIGGKSGTIDIQAPNIDMNANLNDLRVDHALAAAVHGVTASLGLTRVPACTIEINSTIPVASGLGSGAAVSVAIIRALAGLLGQPLSDEKVSALAYEVEKIHHGTPSGIDNTVVTYAKPVYFVKKSPSPAGTPQARLRREARGEGIIETFNIAKPFTVVIGDTGLPSPTKESVGDVRKGWQANPEKYETLFAAAGSITKAARQAIEGGFPERLGPLMNENHELLQEMDVSSPELDLLVKAASDAGALGAKLSGGGRGGNMIALTSENNADEITAALIQSGAVRTITTRIE